MKWFGRKSLETSHDGRRPALSAAGAMAALGSWPTSYEAQVRAGYLENAIAQRAVRMVAEGVAAAPITGADAELVRLVTRGRCWSRRSRRSCCCTAMPSCNCSTTGAGASANSMRFGPSG